MLGPTRGVYVVRVWLEPTPDGVGAWRASLTDVETRERHSFGTPEALSDFLSRMGAEAEDERRGAL